MSHEVRDCHVTREDKGDGAGEQTQREQQSANPSLATSSAMCSQGSGERRTTWGSA
jgi:hypothetical protein